MSRVIEYMEEIGLTSLENIKFSSLYCDIVYLFVGSITTPHNPEISKENEKNYRYDLMRDFSVIFMYSGLIKRNIARIIPPNFSICPDCFRELIVNDNELKMVDAIIDEYAKKAIIEASSYDERRKIGFMKIKNLPEIVSDHDVAFMTYKRDDITVLENINSFPTVIDDREVILRHVKDYMYNNYYVSKFEAFMSSSYNSKLVTSKISDKMIIEAVSDGTIGRTPPPVFEMPFLEKIDSETVLKLRESENHIFNDYRIALDKATKEYLKEGNTGREQEIYDDVIYPAFVKLDGMFKRMKRMRIFRAVGELAVTASTVTVGVMNSIIPANPVGILTALGSSGALLKQINKVIDNKLSTKDELAAKDLYFLWQLKNKA